MNFEYKPPPTEARRDLLDEFYLSGLFGGWSNEAIKTNQRVVAQLNKVVKGNAPTEIRALLFWQLQNFYGPDQDQSPEEIQDDERRRNLLFGIVAEVPRPAPSSSATPIKVSHDVSEASDSLNWISVQKWMPTLCSPARTRIWFTGIRTLGSQSGMRVYWTLPECKRLLLILEPPWRNVRIFTLNSCILLITWNPPVETSRNYFTTSNGLLDHILWCPCLPELDETESSSLHIQGFGSTVRRPVGPPVW